jgi:hypothetical protein
MPHITHELPDADGHGVQADSKRPLVVTDDTGMLSHLLRLARQARLTVDTAADVRTASRYWPDAPVVVVGSDHAARCAAGLPRRRGVILVSRDPDDGEIWCKAVRLGAGHVAFLPDGDAWLAALFTQAGGGHRETPSSTADNDLRQACEPSGVEQTTSVVPVDVRRPPTTRRPPAHGTPQAAQT